MKSSGHAFFTAPCSERKGNLFYSKISTELGIVYTKVDGVELRLDAHVPEGDGPFPGLILLHGGGWRKGNRSAVTDRCIFYASQGFGCFTASYRLTPDHKFPAQIHDVKAAIRWVREHADQFSVDADRLGVMGFSAGAHLAALAGTTDENDGLEGPAARYGVSTRVQAVVAYFGPTDLRKMAGVRHEELPTVLHDFLGGPPDEMPEAYEKSSPIVFVTPDDPPFLFVHGTEDPLVPVEQSTIMADALKKVGVFADVIAIEGGGHGAMPWEAEVRPKVLAFFNEHLAS